MGDSSKMLYPSDQKLAVHLPTTSSTILYAGLSTKKRNFAGPQRQLVKYLFRRTFPGLFKPSAVEIRKNIQALGHRKTRGSDGLASALIKDRRRKLVSEFCFIRQCLIFRENRTFQGESFIVLVLYMSLSSECANHVGIDLISIASKILASIVHNKREEQTQEEQTEICVGLACTAQIFGLRVFRALNEFPKHSRSFQLAQQIYTTVEIN